MSFHLHFESNSSHSIIHMPRTEFANNSTFLIYNVYGIINSCICFPFFFPIGSCCLHKPVNRRIVMLIEQHHLLQNEIWCFLQVITNRDTLVKLLAKHTGNVSVNGNLNFIISLASNFCQIWSDRLSVCRNGIKGDAKAILYGFYESSGIRCHWQGNCGSLVV